MKLPHENREVYSNATGAEYSFKMDHTNPVIFSILRKQIYENPVDSCVREILSNARDAQRERGNPDTPISIILPGSYLVIRDYGVGMSPDRIENIYCAYGASTKRLDNNQTGGFGLGAKSVFAIADSFIVDTHFAAKRYVYNAYIDSTGVGKIKLVQEEDSDEWGTAIKIPSNYSTQTQLRQSVEKYCQFWEVVPKIVGSIIPLESLQVLIEGEGWRSYQKDLRGEVKIICDEIPYTFYDNILNKLPRNTVLKFNTGELELSATRERIINSDNNNKAIREAFDKYKSCIKKETQDYINKLSNIEHALKYISNSPLFNYNDPTEREWEWKGQKFRWPLDYNNPILYYYKGAWRGKSRVSSTDFLPEDGNVVLAQDIEKIKGYNTQRLSSLINERKLKKVWIINESQKEVVPGLTYTKLEDIKVKRQASPSNVVKSKLERLQIKCKSLGRHGFQRNRKVDINSYGANFYIEEGDELKNKFKFFTTEIYEISKKNIRYIQGKPNWHNLSEYMDKWTEDEQKEFVLQLRREKLWRLAIDFVTDKQVRKHIHKDLLPKEDFEWNTTDKVFFELLSANDLPEGVPEINISSYYPMLEFCSYYNFNSSKKEILDYIKMVNKNTKNGDATNEQS